VKRQAIPAWPLVGLGAVYVIVVFADFFAPCDPAAQDSDNHVNIACEDRLEQERPQAGPTHNDFREQRDAEERRQ
jgi:hypothetical protein